MESRATIEPEVRPPAPRRRVAVASVLVGLCYFLVACWLTPDYGPTWDVVRGGYPYGDEVLMWLGSEEPDFVEFARQDLPPEMRQPYPDFYKQQFSWHQVYPVAGTLSALANWLLWDKLGWVSAMTAHQIVIPLLVTLLVIALVAFLGRQVGLGAGIAAAVLMLTSPRFLAHSINNLKDMPECVFYSLAFLAAYRCLSQRGIHAWCWLGAALALALAQKANALFLPFQVLLFYGLARLMRSTRGQLRIHWPGLWAAVFVFLGLYLAVSPAFWHDTAARIGEHFGEVGRIGGTGPLRSILPDDSTWMQALSAPFQTLITTPPMVLILAGLGLLGGRAPALLRLFLLLGAAFPVGRLLLPGVRDFDGIRHFIEFYPWLCGLAGLGLCRLLQLVSAAVRIPRPWPALVTRSALVLALLPGLVVSIQTHPHGICYFNSFVGGLAGAQRLGIPDATDYWAHSYWHGATYLNDHATADAALCVPIAKTVVVSTAPVRLRPDIRLQPAGIEETPGDLYVMYVTRRPFYDLLVRQLERHSVAVHEIRVQGGIILKIHRLVTQREKEEAYRLLAEERRLPRLKWTLLEWIQGNPRRLQALREVFRVDRRQGREAGIDELCRVQPMLSRDDAARILGWVLRYRD